MKTVEIFKEECDEQCGGDYVVRIDGEYAYCLQGEDLSVTNFTFGFLHNSDAIDYKWKELY